MQALLAVKFTPVSAKSCAWLGNCQENSLPGQVDWVSPCLLISAFFWYHFTVGVHVVSWGRLRWSSSFWLRMVDIILIAFHSHTDPEIVRIVVRVARVAILNFGEMSLTLHKPPKPWVAFQQKRQASANLTCAGWNLASAATVALCSNVDFCIPFWPQVIVFHRPYFNTDLLSLWPDRHDCKIASVNLLFIWWLYWSDPDSKAWIGLASILTALWWGTDLWAFSQYAENQRRIHPSSRVVSDVVLRQFLQCCRKGSTQESSAAGWSLAFVLFDMPFQFIWACFNLFECVAVGLPSAHWFSAGLPLTLHTLRQLTQIHSRLLVCSPLTLEVPLPVATAPTPRIYVLVILISSLDLKMF